MIEPDFREPQLQQTINGAFLLWGQDQGSGFLHPVVPSLPEEKLLGWDSAFFFPWLVPGPNYQHHGCNFFLQYKISVVVEGHNGGQYADWNQSYYRFKIPHNTKVGGQYVTDYHQLHVLQGIASQQYKVYYATNQVTSRHDLFSQAEAGTLLDNTPFLSVSHVQRDHYYVTFTPTSPHFFLHSEAEECRRHSFEMLSTHLRQAKRRPLGRDNQMIFEAVLPFLKEIRGTETYIDHFMSLDGDVQLDGPDRRLAEMRQWFMLRAGMRRFFDLELMRFGEWE
jgi:hypothetical protein